MSESNAIEAGRFESSSDDFVHLIPLDEPENAEPDAIRRKVAKYLEQRRGRTSVGGQWRHHVLLRAGDEVVVGQLRLTVTALSHEALVLTARQPGASPREYCVSGDAEIIVREGEVLTNPPDEATRRYITATVFSHWRDWSLDVPFGDDASVDYGGGAFPYRGRRDVRGSCKVITDRGSVELRWADDMQSLDVVCGGAACGVVTGHALLELMDGGTSLFDEFLLMRYDPDTAELVVMAGDVLFASAAGEDPVIAKARGQSHRVDLTSGRRVEHDDYFGFCRQVRTPTGGIGLAQLLGDREEMEDEVAAASTPSGATLAAVFDGHSGGEASRIARETVEQELPHALDGAPGSIRSALCEVLEQAHQRVMAQPEPSGTAAVVAVVVDEDHHRRLYTANVGDSRAVLGMEQGRALRLTYDHKPYELDEAHGALARGGWVHQDRVGGRLALARALGDADLIDKGVGHDAEVSCVTIDEAARFVILATDGLWDVMADEDAVDFVSLCLDAGRDLAETARRLCEQALLRGSTDNISAVVMSLRALAAGSRS